jgi:hypothetical protein
VALLLAAVLGVCLMQTAGAFQGATIVKIEEDWEVVIGDPDTDSISPQLYVVTTPTADISGLYSVFEINNLLLPNFYGGGLQFQTWVDDVAVGETHHSNYSAFATSGETVTFTVGLRVYPGDGLMRFRVKNGQSQTWGAFGSSPSLTIYEQSDLQNLSSYSPDKSAYYSRVGFGGNRVQKMVIKQVRYYDSNLNLVATDNTERDATAENP